MLQVNGPLASKMKLARLTTSLVLHWLVLFWLPSLVISFLPHIFSSFFPTLPFLQCKLFLNNFPHSIPLWHKLPPVWYICKSPPLTFHYPNSSLACLTLLIPISPWFTLGIEADHIPHPFRNCLFGTLVFWPTSQTLPHLISLSPSVSSSLPHEPPHSLLSNLPISIDLLISHI